MRRIAAWIAAASTAALLAGGLTGAPAYAEVVPSPPVATTINLRYAAVDSTVTVTGASTVDDAITELQLAVDGDDGVSPARDTALVDGMSLVIDVVSVTTSTTKQTVKYQEEDDPQEDEVDDEGPQEGGPAQAARARSP